MQAIADCLHAVFLAPTKMVQYEGEKTAFTQNLKR
jgi:hypothetical protein